MNNCEGVPSHNISFMGYTVRTASFRYTEWLQFDCSTQDPMSHCADPAHASPQWDQLVATELYDHRGAPPYPTDFDASENENVAANVSHAAVIAELGARLRAMFP